MTTAWVIGSGGLIGRSLVRELDSRGIAVYRPPVARWAWDQEGTFRLQVATAVDGFVDWARRHGSWSIYWAAGTSSMSSSEAFLSMESRLVGTLVNAVASNAPLMATRGAFALVSSAGGVYSGARTPLISEETPPAPTNPYGAGKLHQEDLLVHPALIAAGCRTLLARVSTVYGPFQAKGRRQGLISHIARCIVRRQPAAIFVPLDTIRDYIYADDAARVLVESLQACRESDCPTIKIVASERPATVADIIGTFQRVSHRALRFTTQTSPASSLYVWRSRFRSVVFPELARLSSTPLLVGVERVLRAAQAEVAMCA